MPRTSKVWAETVLRSVKYARSNLIDDLVKHALRLAPAADLIGDGAPEHVRLAKAILDRPDNADREKLAIQFLFAVLTLKVKGSAA